MSAATTRESLSVFVDGEERPGLTFYAYWDHRFASCPQFPANLMPARRVENGRLSGERWAVCYWDVELESWPEASEWDDLLCQTLTHFAGAGASVTWCGLEGFFADPPELFDPAQMSGGVYAAYAPGWGFKCAAPLDGPLGALTDSDLRALAQFLDPQR